MSTNSADHGPPSGTVGPQPPDLLAALAHDLRNVVGSICTYLEILTLHQTDAPAAARARQAIQRKSSDLVRMAERLRRAVDSPSAAVSPSGASAAASAGAGRSRRVLVVDDDPEAAASIATLLRLWNYDVLVCYDGASAIRVAAEYHPHVCLLDIWMPGLNGYQAAESLRREPRLKDTLLIAMTGYDQYGDQQLARDAGFDHHLFKPVEIGALRQILEGPASEKRQHKPPDRADDR